MFKTGDKNFWKAQLIGWSIMGLSNLIVQLIANIPIQYVLLNTFIPPIIGFSISTGFRYLIKGKNWIHWGIGKIILLIICSTIVQTIVLNGIVFSIFYFFVSNSDVNIAEILSNSVILGILFLAWNLIYFFVHYFNNWHYSEIEKWKLVAEMKDAELGSLKSQVNPHFVFNSINNIRALILEDKDKARDMLMNFSDLFRYSLTHTNKQTVLLSEELEVVHQYLELLAIQFEEKLKYNIQLDDSLLTEKVPPMVLQILVENAVKHGISQSKDGGTIDIAIYKNKNAFYIEVKNSGSLNIKSSLGEKLGLGLENIKNRLRILYNENGNLNVTEKNNYVIASIKIPLL